jgi:hypothetical protein
VTMARSGVVPRDRRDSPVVRGELKSQERRACRSAAASG